MKSTIVILAGEGEYQSDISMRALEGDLRANASYDVHMCVPDILEDAPDFPICTVPGLEALQDADLLVVYTRFRRLHDAQMEMLQRYLDRRGSVVGLRTSTHAFKFTDDSPWATWNDGFGTNTLGSPWITHHGHASTTEVTRVPGAEHQVLEGVDDAFSVRSWLYVVKPEPDCVPLLHGDPVNAKRESMAGPVAWVRPPSAEHGKVAYTSLGHPADFGVPAFRRLLLNSVSWCLDAD
jgi:type 1 glutamine amidotransferase